MGKRSELCYNANSTAAQQKMGTAVQRFPFAQLNYHSTRSILFPFSLYPIFALFSYGTSHLANGEKLGYYENTKKE